MPDSFVAVLMGSDSDLPIVDATLETLKKLEIHYEVRITSAHRTPEQTSQYVQDADQRGCQVFIAAAGMAAHLAGAVAANTIKPVIGIPLNAGSLGGFDALLATVQMPAGIPVATVAIGKAGAKNAAYLAGQIMAVADESLATRLKAERQANQQVISEKNQALQAKLGL
ncbi:MAG: 5-(carboxyamino)imidazole ribonucleotide mutase [Methylococcales bacterium]|jgi:5-(carboxyamino)imidazole ribonucleotide mutase|nr:5-(carboxyamino)imidazole ribonucleotide mutase [Methylococcales bacterium]MBT7409745.1 5-(carboxyamino)imidazole ribonucleotide mutase [Methylococcales bacterium]